MTYMQIYYSAHREELKAKSRAYYASHRSEKKAYYRTRNYRRRMEVLEALGGAFCKQCGFSDWRALHIDHLNGGGIKERSELGLGLRYFRHVMGNPAKYQVLCANCNFIKRHTNGEH